LDRPAPRSTAHGLAFLVFLSFIASFLTARAFATLNPDVVVISGGIHFHHFWYGLTMIVVAGWLGIVYDDQRYRRFCAVLFGLGCGIFGDEVGLLLTFGSYDSELTLYFFVTVVSVGAMALLLLRYRELIEHDVLSLPGWESAMYLGVGVAGLSSLCFGSGLIAAGAAVLAAGCLIAAGAFWWHRR